jgi:hypothetical protein
MQMENSCLASELARVCGHSLTISFTGKWRLLYKFDPSSHTDTDVSKGFM